MTVLTNALRATSATALVGGFAFAAAAIATADPNTGSSADINTLAGSLSKGYGLNNCTAQAISDSQRAVLACGQNPDSSGPVVARYYLFSGSDAMKNLFNTSIKEDVLTACGDSSTQSPSPWHQVNSGGNAGQMACGTYQNAAEIIWTTDAKNMLSYVRASNSDAQSLYRWWRANG